ncbi:MAG TPA: FtsX-like permease family protein [Cyclobacteriaceae bacterium]|nr:FtsX-like permease family protein [Cyclobacteriaceae bacterium]
MNSRTPIPPKLAKRLLLRFLRDDLAEEVQGDLDEKFYATVKSKSLFKAKLNYWYQVVNYLRPFALSKFKFSNSNPFDMFQNYFKVGFRNLFRNKAYSFINVSGLAFGMAVAIMIGLWVYDEVSFNSYHKNRDTIGRVLRNGTLNGETFTTTYEPYPLAEELRTKYGSSFKHVLATWAPGDHIISAGEKNLIKNGSFIEPGAPEMLTLNMKKGNWSALKDQHSIIISSSLATSLFGDNEPMGQLMRIENRMDVKVAGVYEDLPANTHFAGVDFFAPFELFVSVNSWMTGQGFKNNFLDVYVELQRNISFEQASEQIKDAILNHVSDDKEFAAVNPQIFIHPMKKWHLYSEWKNGVNTGGLIQFVWLFGIVGIFVLLLACINFMNLSTARAERRAKEVGIRKTVGSIRKQLMGQFFTESFVVVLFAFIFSVALVAGTLNWFNELSGKHIAIPATHPEFWMISLVFIIITSLLAGSYPAFYLSSFQPVKVLKGVLRSGRLASLPRKVLVIVQFTVSVTLVIGTIVVYNQIQHTKNRPVGYDRNGLVMIPLNSPDYSGKLEALQNDLKNTGYIENVALSQSPVTGIWSSNGGFDWRDKDPALQAEFATLGVSHEYGKTVGWQFVDGRDFSLDHASDSAAFIINETAAHLMNFDNPIDEIVTWSPGWREKGSFKILGVIKDMVMRSPFDPVMPTVFFIDNRINWINIRLKSGISTANALHSIESVFKKIVPNVPFDYKFADDEYAQKFVAEERIGKLSAVFSSLAILISCLGLFGLASFIAAQRTKEIGIRKVVGASVFSLWKMLSKDFIVLVIISSIISIPIGWYLLSNWLQNYSYRVEISWWTFAVSVGGAVFITILTVSYQAIKAALMNPINSLRSE